MKILRYLFLLALLFFSLPSTSSAIALMPDNPIKILTYSDNNTNYYIFGNSLNPAADDLNSYFSVIMTKEDKNGSGFVMEFITYKYVHATKHFYFRFDSILSSSNGEEPKEIKTSLMWHDLEPLMQSPYGYSLYETLRYGKQHSSEDETKC